jgi:hypothetical protein
MATKLAVLIIHGMGTQTPGFADELIAELKQRLAAHGKDATEVAFAAVFWADITQPAQETYLARARETDELDFLSVRRFVVGALGDAAAYQKIEDPNNSVYTAIHERIQVVIHDLFVNQLGEISVPLVVMAHSLGGHIMSNYIWDMQKGNVTRQGLSGFEKFWSHAGMITFGCNIPLFTFAYKKIEPIEFPSPRLPPKVKALARWYNFYDPDDVLGYPLKPVSAGYARVVDADTAINVGGLLSSWNPASHGKYWTDDSFTRPVATFLATFL